MILSSILKRSINYLLAQRRVHIFPITHSPETVLEGLKTLNLKSIIDIGSNTGQFVSRIATSFPGTQIFCFEPLPSEFQKLHRTVERLGIGHRSRLYNCAIGDSHHFVSMNVHLTHSPSSSFFQSTSLCSEIFPQTTQQSQTEVEVKPLDKVLEKELNDDLLGDSLIKVDVQGYEKHVLLGASRTLMHCSALIVEVNVAKLYENQPTFDEIYSIVSKYNLEFAGVADQVCDLYGNVAYFDALFLRK